MVKIYIYILFPLSEAMQGIFFSRCCQVTVTWPKQDKHCWQVWKETQKGLLEKESIHPSPTHAGRLLEPIPADDFFFCITIQINLKNHKNVISWIYIPSPTVEVYLMMNIHRHLSSFYVEQHTQPVTFLPHWESFGPPLPVISTVLLLEGSSSSIGHRRHRHHLKTNTVLPAGKQNVYKRDK